MKQPDRPDRPQRRHVNTFIAEGDMVDVFDAARLLHGRSAPELVRDVMADYLRDQATDPDIAELIETRVRRREPQRRGTPHLIALGPDDPAPAQLPDDYFRSQYAHGGVIVMVPDHDPINLHNAARAAIKDWSPTGTATPEATQKAIGGFNRAVVYREHITDPQLALLCDCDDVGEWCEKGDGRIEAFFWFDMDTIDAAVGADD